MDPVTKTFFMKLIKVIGHPVVMICTFLLFITEGENFGGFYMVYLLLALPHGALYALLAFIGILSIVIGLNLNQKPSYWIKPCLYLIGLTLMVLSLVDFFATGDQSDTFKQGVPLASFLLLCLSSLCFLALSFSLFQKNLSKPAGLIS